MPKMQVATLAAAKRTTQGDCLHMLIPRSAVLYGATGTWKTISAGRLARYIYKRYGKRTRLITFDGGGSGPVKSEIDAGLIIPYRPPSIRNSLAVIRRFMDGYWPKVISIPDPFKPGTTQVSARMCPTTDPEWSEIGAVVVEGWTAISKVFMADCIMNKRVINEDVPSGWTQSAPELGILDDQDFSGATWGHYNFVQQEMWRLTQAFLSQPVEYVLFTALERKGEDKETRETVIGPSIEGRQATGQSPSWVGDCIHMESYAVPKVIDVPAEGELPASKTTITEMKVRGWFKQHTDPVLNLPYPCKVRLATDLYPELEARYPSGYFPVNAEQGFDTFLAYVDELNDRGSDKGKQWIAEVDATRSKA